MTQLFISGNPALTPDQLTTRNLLDNSKQIIVDGTNATEDFWTAIPIGKSIPINTHLTVSFQSVMHEDVKIFGGSTYKERFNSIDHDNPTDWRNIVDDVKQSYTNNCEIRTFNVIENLPYAYLVLWSGKSMQYVKQILSNVMVQFGDKATVWTPSLHDMGIPTLDDFNELKSHLGGDKAPL